MFMERLPLDRIRETLNQYVREATEDGCDYEVQLFRSILSYLSDYEKSRHKVEETQTVANYLSELLTDGREE